jgi:hypothetical protein
MINNARAESDAITARTGEGKVLPTTERIDYADKGSSVPLSDGEGSAFDEDMDALKLRRGAHVKRGSI